MIKKLQSSFREMKVIITEAYKIGKSVIDLRFGKGFIKSLPTSLCQREEKYFPL